MLCMLCILQFVHHKILDDIPEIWDCFDTKGNINRTCTRIIRKLPPLHLIYLFIFSIEHDPIMIFEV